MTTRILSFSSSLTAALFVGVFAFSPSSHAGELDNESQVINEQALRSKDLPQTVVVRIDESTGEASVLESAKALPADSKTLPASLAEVEAMSSKFKAIPKSNELDRNSSSSSWYAWYNYNYYCAPTYYYYGYSYAYTNYYSYRNYGYSYYWYRWY